jgi:hypothetical protein
LVEGIDMPLDAREQSEFMKLQEKYGPKSAQPRTLSEKERAGQRVETQTFGDLVGVPSGAEYPGSATARSDSLTLGIASKPGSLDPSAALQDSIAARLLRGDVAGAEKLRLPAEPSFGVREVADPATGESIFVRVNSRTGNMEPISSGFSPTGAKNDEKAEIEQAMSRANAIASKLANIDSILNNPSMKEGTPFQDEFGQTKYFDKTAISKERAALVSEQKYYFDKQGQIEARQLSASGFVGPKGHMLKSPSGRIYVSDGEKYNPSK